MFCKHVFAVSHNNRQIHYCFCYFIPIAIMAMHPTNILGYIILYFLNDTLSYLCLGKGVFVCLIGWLVG